VKDWFVALCSYCWGIFYKRRQFIFIAVYEECFEDGQFFAICQRGYEGNSFLLQFVKDINIFQNAKIKHPSFSH
jgi:hypothetical protein